MQIIVCIKEVAEWQDSQQGKPAGILVRVNPQDLVALEAALTLRERLGGEVIALSLGTEEEALRRALTIGADRAILVEDAGQGEGDWHTTSLILAQAALWIGFDLILCGTWRVDEMDGAVGIGIAEHLGVPAIVHVVKIEVSDDKNGVLRASKRLPKGVRETYEVRLPCILAVDEELNQPRYVPIMGRSYRQGLTRPMERLTIPELGIAPEALSPKVTVLELAEMKPRIRLGVKVTGLSIEEKLRLLGEGTPTTGEKRELVVHEPQKAAERLLKKLSEWIKEEKT